MERIALPSDPAKSSLCAKVPANPTLKGKGYKQLVSAHVRSCQFLRKVLHAIKSRNSPLKYNVQGLTTDGSITVYNEKHVKPGK